MIRVLIQKGIGVALILSGLILLTLKIINIPESIETANAWAAPKSGTTWFIGFLVIEFVLLAARFALGYLVYINQQMSPWLFYPLASLICVSGLSGIILIATVIVLRFLQGHTHATKT